MTPEQSIEPLVSDETMERWFAVGDDEVLSLSKPDVDSLILLLTNQHSVTQALVYSVMRLISKVNGSVYMPRDADTVLLQQLSNNMHDEFVSSRKYLSDFLNKIMTKSIDGDGK